MVALHYFEDLVLVMTQHVSPSQRFIFQVIGLPRGRRRTMKTLAACISKQVRLLDPITLCHFKSAVPFADSGGFGLYRAERSSRSWHRA